MPIYRQSIIFSIISPTPNHKCSSSRQNGFDPSIPPFPITPFLFDRAVLPSSPMRLFNIDFVLSLISMSGKSQSEVLLYNLCSFIFKWVDGWMDLLVGAKKMGELSRSKWMIIVIFFLFYFSSYRALGIWESIHKF